MAQQQKERKARWKQQEEQSSSKKKVQRKLNPQQPQGAQIRTPPRQQESTTQEGSRSPRLHQQTQRPMVGYNEACTMPLDKLEQLRNEGLVSDELWNMRMTEEDRKEEERRARSTQYEREEQDRMRVKQDWIDYYRYQREHKEKEARKQQQQREAREQQARQQQAQHKQQQASSQQQTWQQQQPGTSQTQSRQRQQQTWQYQQPGPSQTPTRQRHQPQQSRPDETVPEYTYIGGCDYVPFGNSDIMKNGICSHKLFRSNWIQ
jgi:hypothetical protein